jgi:hypothetical protein
MKPILLVVIGVALIATVGLLSFFVFWYVPNTLGRQYVSVSFQPLFHGGESFLHLVYEGRAINAAFVSVAVNITNSYFVPVQFSYNGFDAVWLIYSQRVSDPSDIDGNRAALVYGAYSSLNIWNERYAGIRAFSTGGYQTYDAMKSFVNFTATINPGTAVRNQDLFFNGFNEPDCWLGRFWLNNSDVSPGTYFMYCIILGIPTGPLNMTVTSMSSVDCSNDASGSKFIVQ